MGHVTAPNSLLRTCRCVGHKLSTILCRCLTGPLQDQWNNKAPWASLSTVSFLSPSELLLRFHTKCVVENTHPSTVPGKLLGRSYLWLDTQLKMYIILFTISSSKRILELAKYRVSKISPLLATISLYLSFSYIRIFCLESEHQFDFILQLVETGIFSQHKAAQRHTSYLKKIRTNFVWVQIDQLPPRLRTPLHKKVSNKFSPN